ncbi:hypothetical protein ACFYP4_02225 [Streptomyces sp. NPDC005551]|uniref:hypothetical protein n=1 Tax=Streptomyces sp. NPDC005551 TaxID=3364725 RepID=UPI0036A8E46A
MGDGMEQGEARRRAKELGGIAVSARRGSTGNWNIGGWPEAKDVWIVISLDQRVVLDDGGAGSPQPLKVPQKEG